MNYTDEASDIEFEIAWRKRLAASLARVLTTYNKNAEKEHLERVARQAGLREAYPDEEAAQEAFGYGEISEAEYRAIVDQLDEANEPTMCSAARDELRQYIGRLRQGIRDFEWQLLPETEKERINKQNEERRNRRRPQ